MPKKLYIIGGTMGVGKTTTCQLLKNQLDRCVFLDGDWCWDMHPFQLTDATRAMVLDNICHLLNNYLRCDAFENIVFCWVLHTQSLLDELLSRLDLRDCAPRLISLVRREDALVARLRADVARGVRTADVIARSVARIALYENLNTLKLDVSDMSPAQAAARIRAL